MMCERPPAAEGGRESLTPHLQLGLGPGLNQTLPEIHEI